MKIRIKRRLALEDILQKLGSIVNTGEKEYKFLPYWFEFDGDSIFLHSLGNLPDELVKFIENERDNATFLPKSINDLIQIAGIIEYTDLNDGQFINEFK